MDRIAAYAVSWRKSSAAKSDSNGWVMPISNLDENPVLSGKIPLAFESRRYNAVSLSIVRSKAVC